MANSVFFEAPKNPHFFQPILPGFHSHLSIPVKFFSVYIEGRNEKNTVELRSDASEKTWTVKMEGRKLTEKWKEFVVAHDFRVGDIVIFRHEGDLVFHVTGLGQSCCEIEYVQDNIENLSIEQNRKTEQESSPEDDVKVKENKGKFPRKKHGKKRNLEAETESFSSDLPCFVARVTDSNLRDDILNLPKNFVRPQGPNKGKNKIVLMDEGARTWTVNLRFRDSSGTFYMRTGWRSFCHENGLKPGDSVTFKQESNNTRTPILRFSALEIKSVSTKRSSKGKRKTGEMELVTLTATPASLKYSRLYLPLNFIMDNKMETAGGKKITMLDKKGVKWPVSLLFIKGTRRMHFGSGLREFLEAIGVQENESFTLELDWEDTTVPPIFKFCSKTKTSL
ncbi:hypothetical protein AALP_AA7G175000 [Arabis alpina]|uniref:TF-B3 domain-containing protein n=1 Tax=Arabis alpina TaxID=50452 RepID=A0A087GIQ4_ARAAL|nr:hypothetical protein AALP_AA7G175000 [Arabis alpina]